MTLKKMIECYVGLREGNCVDAQLFLADLVLGRGSYLNRFCGIRQLSPEIHASFMRQFRVMQLLRFSDGEDACNAYDLGDDVFWYLTATPPIKHFVKEGAGLFRKHGRGIPSFDLAEQLEGRSADVQTFEHLGTEKIWMGRLYIHTPTINQLRAFYATELDDFKEAFLPKNRRAKHEL